MPFPFTFVLGMIPWKTILTEAPKIVREARQLHEVVGKNRVEVRSSPRVSMNDLPEVSEALDELRLRIDEIEAHDAKQGELIAQIAAQGEALSQGLQIVVGRMNAMAWIAAIATLVAVIALVVAVLN